MPISKLVEAKIGICVLVVDDDAEVRSICSRALQTAGFRVAEASCVPEAITILEDGSVEIVLSDVCMPDVDGLRLLHMVREYYPATSVVMMTGYATIANAVEAMRMGASDYLTKPITPEDLTCRLSRLVELRSIEIENRAFRAQLSGLTGVGKLIGASAEMQTVFQFIMRAAPARAPVLIQGESGTGKELVARAIHDNGPSKDRPFVAIDCGALPENLIERELFGHVRGAFTDARQDQPGLLASAANGTVFFDEIAELPLGLQSKLLRALQEKEFRPLGSTQYVPLPARIIAATNRDLKLAQAEGKFRSDLYYRLNVLQIVLPTLRERGRDIELLANHFLYKQRETGCAVVGISRQARDLLSRYAWPGNVRELENAIQFAALLAGGSTIEAADLPPDVRSLPEPGPREDAAPAGELGYLREAERRTILEVLAAAHGDRKEAARRLGTSKSWIYAKLKEYGIGG
jgi:two-component system response regulator HydG